MIRILQETDAQVYQEIRLNGLLANPEAFGSTYEREAGFTLEMFKERIKPSQDRFVLGAFEDDSLVGIVSFVRETSIKTSHKANVYGMFVRKEMQGKGIGKSLMLELIRHARECAGLERINLTVVSTNEAAKKLYQSIGFVVYGVERDALKYHGQYADEDLMVLVL